MGGLIRDGYLRRVVIGKPDGLWPQLRAAYRPLRGRDKAAADRLLKFGEDGRPYVDLEQAAAMLAQTVAEWSLLEPVTEDALLDLPLETFNGLVNVVLLGAAPDGEEGEAEPLPEAERLEADAKN